MKLLSTIALLIFGLFHQSGAQSLLEPPQSLEVEISFNSVTLSWLPPSTSNGEFLSWDNGLNFEAIGLTSGGIFTAAAKWEPQQLSGYEGRQIEQIGFFPRGENSLYTLKVWFGDTADSLVVSQPVSEILANQWNTVSLDTPVFIDGSTAIWVGYEVDQPEDEWPAGVDAGPPANGFGNLILFQGEWLTLADFGLNYNWNLRAYIGEGQVPESLEILSAGENRSRSIAGLPEISGSGPIGQINSGTESLTELLGYNVYQNGEKINDQILTQNIYSIFFLNVTNYVFGVTAVYDEGESDPVEIEVEIGGSNMVFSPSPVEDTLSSGETSEVEVLLINQGDLPVDFGASPTQNWIGISPASGNISANDSIQLIITIDATSLTGGNYFGNISFAFNNVVSPYSQLPVNVVVNGSPEISAEPQFLDFGAVQTGSTSSAEIVITNTGTDFLLIDSIVSNSANFSIENPGIQLYPFQDVSIFPTFSPDSVGVFNGVISVYSNATNQQQLDIAVTGIGSLAAPSYFQASVDGSDVLLEWLPPQGIGGEWLSWDSGNNYTSIGLTAGGTFSYAARWTPETLTEYNGFTALQVAFFAYSEISNYTLKIWTGSNAQNLIISRPVQSVNAMEWNLVTIPAPFAIDASETLWVGFTVTQPMDEFPAGVDEGPAVQNFGDMLTLDGVNWISISTEYGLNYNWNIQLLVSDSVQAQQPVVITPGRQPMDNPGVKPERNPSSPIKSGSFAMNVSENAELLGYNLYRNNLSINQSPITELSFIDEGLENGIYDYDLTAVYDIGESVPVSRQVQVGGPTIFFDPDTLFVEVPVGEISTDTFAIGNSGNINLEWFLSSPIGIVIPSPDSGVVQPGGLQEITITTDASTFFEGTYVIELTFSTNDLNNSFVVYPMILTVIGEPELNVNPDILAFGQVQAGEEKTLLLEISNTGFVSFTVSGFATDNPAFSVQDTTIFLGIFQSTILPVTFVPDATGVFEGMLSFSSTLEGFENIEVPLTGEGILEAPLNLSALVENQDVLLTWIPPDGEPGEWLQYSSELLYTSVGLSQEGTFSVAAKWEPDDLEAYAGSFVTWLGFGPRSANSSYILKVWQGSNAEILLVSQPVEDFTVDQWNEVLLDAPVEILPETTLWFGYEVVQPEWEFPAGTDQGPAIAGKGDLVSLDGETWDNLSDYGLSYNWNIKAFASESTSKSVAIPMVMKHETYNNAGMLVHKIKPVDKQNHVSIKNSTEILGYKIYRNDVLITPDPVTATNYADTAPGLGIFSYQVSAVYDPGESPKAGPVEVIIEEPAQLPGGWDHVHTQITHVVYIPTFPDQLSVTPLMNEGDWIGAFFNDGFGLYCAGAVQWTESDTLKVVVFGDNPSTPEKEGFEIGEEMIWKVFMPETGEEHQLGVEYHNGMPNHDGTFDNFGQSMILDMWLTPTSVDESGISSTHIYPNPGKGIFYFSGSEKINRLEVINSQGRVIFRKEFEKTSEGDFDLSGYSKGIYYVKMYSSDGINTRKIIIH